MTAADLLPHLECVRPRGPGKWSARCPAHPDKSPSLSIMEGYQGILLRCFAGCSLANITKALGLRVADLFYDAGLADSAERRTAMRQRAKQKAAQLATYESQGRRLDALRVADHLIQSARGLSIAEWPDDKLNAELDRLGLAYALLESEGRS